MIRREPESKAVGEYDRLVTEMVGVFNVLSARGGTSRRICGVKNPRRGDEAVRAAGAHESAACKAVRVLLTQSERLNFFVAKPT